MRVGGELEPEFRVEEDLVLGTEPLVVPVLEFVECSVLKLALERLRISLRKAGAMTHLAEKVDTSEDPKMSSQDD